MLGVWLYARSNEYAMLTDGQWLFGAALLTAVGVGVTIVGCMGVVGTVWESHMLLNFVRHHLHLLYVCVVIPAIVWCNGVHHVFTLSHNWSMGILPTDWSE